MLLGDDIKVNQVITAVCFGEGNQMKDKGIERHNYVKKVLSKVIEKTNGTSQRF